MKFDNYNLIVGGVCMLTGAFVPSLRWVMLSLQIGLTAGAILGRHYIE